MEKKIIKILVLFAAFHFAGVLFYSCEDPVDCGGFSSRYAVDAYTLTEASYEGEYFSGTEIVKDDTVIYSEFKLQLNAIYTAIANRKVNNSGIFSNCVACSPPPLTPIDSIASIKVNEFYGTNDIASANSTEISNKFNIVTFSESEEFSSETSLIQFNETAHPAYTELFLFYTEKPEETIRIGFNVIVQLTNGETFEVSSKLFYIAPE